MVVFRVAPFGYLRINACLVCLSLTFTWLLVAVLLFGSDTGGVGGVWGLVVVGLIAFA